MHSLYSGINFTINNTEELPMSELDAKKLSEQPGTYYDLRTNVLSRQTDFSNMQWYYNYISTLEWMAVHHSSDRLNTLLDLGFVPVICLPSCNLSPSLMWFRKLDAANLEYISIHAVSFLYNRCDIDTSDAWVSKLVASEKFGIPVEQVRSVDIIRKVLDG